ncbi:hypothetical protein OKA04_10550 [Luteolibacter flavescens]|uniref:Methyltransferase FkbM domain-containing protein n=1 Tax=Luteolibacter flavescens TaxID=1859460 RepID=A0ABT3FNP1_9BACT|nr:FkbM family methyltransferase [Luteolibacter flavescens]MCW1885168.1 hypothetical protein [Luteolibacter flavescens]
MLKKLLKRVIPPSALKRFSPLWENYKNDRFKKQKTGYFEFHGIRLGLPDRHPLPGLVAAQPYRDLCIGIVAKFISAKYPGKAIIDIGANVGDTAAILAAHSRNPLVLIEGSDFFFDYLSENAKRLPNPSVVRKVLISDGSPISGELQHWGGTAEFKESATGPRLETVRLSDVTPDEVCFVKSDTDGHDFKILGASMDWLASQKPVVLFESQIRNAEDLTAADALMESLHGAGYKHFIIWDAAGYHLLSTSELSAVAGLHRYLMKVVTAGVAGNVSNLDVACFHERDLDVFEQTTEWYRSY